MTKRDRKWKNRIVEHGEADPEDLLAHPDNYKIHTRLQQEAMQDVLDQVGWVQEIIVNKRTGFVCDGHLRIILAMRQGESSVPVSYIDVSEQEELLILASLDPIGSLAIADQRKSRELIEQVETESERLRDALRQGLGLDLAGADAEARGESEPELTLSPEMHERHDYVVIYTENEFDWQVLKDLLEIETVACPPVGKKTLRHKGLGRVIKGSDFIKRVERWKAGSQ